jgi:hypothetical protein
MIKVTTLALGSLFMMSGCGNGTAASAGAGAGVKPEPSPDSGVAMGPNGPLGTPPPRTTRVTLEMDAFDVPPGGEVYMCQNFKNPFGRDVDIVQSESQMTPGSHHLIVFKMSATADAGLDPAMAPCSGVEVHNFLHGSQTPTGKTVYPAGVGVPLRETQVLRFNAHYLNTGTDTIHAKVLAAFDAATEPVPTQAGWFFLNNTGVTVPPGASKTSVSLQILPEAGDIKLLDASSHMHRHGVHFAASLSDGTPIYKSDGWSDPPRKTFDSPGFPVPAGSTIDFTCDYQNDSGTTLGFGESASDNEMCVFGGAYYPAPGGKGIFGFASGAGTMFIDDTL